MKKFLNILFWILFLLSFIPYLATVFSALFGAETGYFGNYNVSYGFEAVEFTIFIFSITLIYPACLLFQIIYVIFGLIKAPVYRKIVTVIIVESIIVFTLGPCIIYDLKVDWENKRFFEEHLEEVQEYLLDNYSDEFVSKCVIKPGNSKYRTYIIQIEDEYFNNDYFTVTLSEEIGTMDNFFKKVIEPNENQEFMDGFAEYIIKEYDIPDNLIPRPLVNSIDMKEFSYSDSYEDMYPRIDFYLDSFDIKVDEYNQQELIDLIMYYYNNCDKEYNNTDTYDFTVTYNGRYHARITLYSSNRNSEYVDLSFVGYTYTSEEGPTIKDEWIKVYPDGTIEKK